MVAKVVGVAVAAVEVGPFGIVAIVLGQVLDVADTFRFEPGQDFHPGLVASLVRLQEGFPGPFDRVKFPGADCSVPV